MLHIHAELRAIASFITDSYLGMNLAQNYALVILISI